MKLLQRNFSYKIIFCSKYAFKFEASEKYCGIVTAQCFSCLYFHSSGYCSSQEVNENSEQHFFLMISHFWNVYFAFLLCSGLILIRHFLAFRSKWSMSLVRKTRISMCSFKLSVFIPYVQNVGEQYSEVSCLLKECGRTNLVRNSSVYLEASAPGCCGEEPIQHHGLLSCLFPSGKALSLGLDCSSQCHEHYWLP